MAYHSKEAAVATILCLIIWVFVGCSSLDIAVELEINVIEEPEEEEKPNEENSVEEITG